MEQKAHEYINKLYIDYGDLNEKAEEQIKQAFIDGMKEQLLIQRVVSSLPSECQENWQSNYYCTLSGKCQKCEK